MKSSTRTLLRDFLNEHTCTMISAILPCYNQGEFVEEAIRCLLAQSLVPDEIIVVNDGSTDPFTNELLERGRWERTRVLVQENAGVSAARNAGIRAAGGDLILNLDADDLLAPTFLEKAMALLGSDPGIGAVGSWLQLFGEREGTWEAAGGSVEDYLAGNRSGPNCLFLRTFWEVAGGYDESMRTGFEDWEFWISGCSKGWAVATVPEPLSLYRKKPGVSGVTVAYRHKPEIVRYIVGKHLPLYREHLVRVLFEKEQLIDRIYHSKIYRAGLGATGLPDPLA